MSKLNTMWEYYDTIKSVPNNLWEKYISRNNVCLDKRLFAVCENMFPDTSFYYFIKGRPDAPEIIFPLMIDNDTAETGTPETSGRHFWYDNDKMDFMEFVRQSSEIIQNKFPDLKKIVYRDFNDNQPQPHNISFLRALDVSELIIPEKVKSMEEYVDTLRSKYKYQVKQYLNAVPRDRYSFYPESDYLPLLDELYPLYEDVCLRSTEYDAPPYPPEYFAAVKKEFGEQAVALVVRDIEKDRILGFMLLLYNDAACVHQYIGFERIDNLYLWHNLTLKSIEDSICRGIRTVYMGVTNSIAKHKFGAVSRPNFFAELFI